MRVGRCSGSEPCCLAYFYPHPVLAERVPLRGIALSTAAVLLLSAGAWALRRSRPHLLVGWLWYLGMLVPVVGWVPVGARAHAVAVTRNDFVAHQGLGLALMRAGRLDEAELQLERAVELSPDRPDPSLDFALARLLEARGENERALRHYRLGLESQPGNDVMRRRLEALER